MGEVAAEVGIAKASLYKHYPSKDALAAAAMIQLIGNTLDYVWFAARYGCDRPAARSTQAVEARWRGSLPALPTENTTLRESLKNKFKYVGKILDPNELMGDLIDQAKTDGAIRSDLPTEVMLFTIYSISKSNVHFVVGSCLTKVMSANLRRVHL